MSSFYSVYGCQKNDNIQIEEHSPKEGRKRQEIEVSLRKRESKTKTFSVVRIN